MNDYQKTEDGYEFQFQTNHLAHFLLTLYLLPKLESSADPEARIINVSSMAHDAMCNYIYFAYNFLKI